jgi:hypothetical protein
MQASAGATGEDDAFHGIGIFTAEDAEDAEDPKDAEEARDEQNAQGSEHEGA